MKKRIVKRIVGFLVILIVGAYAGALRNFVFTPSAARLFIERSRTIKSGSSTVYHQAFFPPEDNLEAFLYELIDTEAALPGGKIDVAAFQFTHSGIATHLMWAAKKIQVRIVADVGTIGGRFDQVRFLHQSGIPVYIYPATNAAKNYSLMHNKYIIFHSLGIVFTGSTNFTAAGIGKNRENSLAIYDRDLVVQYAAQFEQLMTVSTRL